MTNFEDLAQGVAYNNQSSQETKTDGGNKGAKDVTNNVTKTDPQKITKRTFLEIRQAMLTLLERLPCPTGQIMQSLNISRRTALKHLRWLETQGSVEHIDLATYADGRKAIGWRIKK